MNNFFLIIVYLTLLNSSVFGYNDHNDMKASTEQRTIVESQIVDANHAYIILNDGSLWSTHPDQLRNNSVNIENFNSPQVGETYNWVSGYYQGFDEWWVEDRRGSRLLVASGVGAQEAFPYEISKESLTITDISYNEKTEVLLLDNSSYIVIPSHHAGYFIGEVVVIHLMRNGSNAYLIHWLDEEQKVLIPLERASPHGFIAH